MTAITIKYSSSVKTAAGWRDITITAEAMQISAGMAQVTKVVDINGEEPTYSMSRTGARRQEFNGKYWADQQIGAKKRLSSCRIVREQVAA